MAGDAWKPRAAALAAALASSIAWAQAAPGPVAYEVAGDAIAQPLAGQSGDAARGRAIVANRQVGLCLLCHSGPFPEEQFQGDLAPSLAGAGARWNEGQLRLRIADSRRVHPQTIMPAYHRTDGLNRVGTAWRDKPILSAQQIEDVVAYLRTLRD
jgi:L-cysteine S-thiosulfotransferase